MHILDLANITIDPELVEIDRILEDEELFQRIKHDLSQRYPKTLITGRNSTPVEVTLRMLVLKHLYNFRYADTVRFVSDSLVLRWFCRIYLNPVCDDKTLLRWANLIQLNTLRLANRRLDAIAYELKLTRGRKLRTDGMVMETNIHHPTDSGLLADGVRVLSRLVKWAKAVLQDTAQLTADTFRDRNRSAHKAARRIHEASHRRGEEAKAGVQEAYRHLVRITQASVAQAKRVLAALKGHKDRQARKLKVAL
jgi:IS5 family transposase